MAKRGSALLLIGVFASTAPLPAVQDVDPNAVRARMQLYLADYEIALRSVVADERFTQWPLRGAPAQADTQYSPQLTRDGGRIRVLESDVAFIVLPANGGWLGIRDTKRVNTKAVDRRGSPLIELVRASPDDWLERVGALLLASAGHNLGAPRTINLPTLPLELLRAGNQARYAIEGVSLETVGGCRTMRLDLRETVRPTLIQRPTGGDMPSRVAAWVEPVTGRLCRAEVRTHDSQLGASAFEAVVRVEFAYDAGLELLVPSRLYEEFLYPPRGRGEGEASYSNYRRIDRGSANR